MPPVQGFSQRQIKILTILFATLLIGLAVKNWRDLQPLPEVDPELEKSFMRIADSLDALDSLKQNTEMTGFQLNESVNINTATASELQLLPGIGPVLANRIISFRDEKGGFKNVEQLLEVRGIGKKTLKKLQGMVVF